MSTAVLDPSRIIELQEALSLLKKNVAKPSAELAKIISKPNSKLYIQHDEAHVGERTWNVRRLFVRTTDTSAVGWVLNEDAKSCMECGKGFGVSKWHHHCRKCGNVVCHPCSRRGKEVDSFESLGEVRVCSRCFYKEHGQRESLVWANESMDNISFISHDGKHPILLWQWR